MTCINIVRGKPSVLKGDQWGILPLCDRIRDCWIPGATVGVLVRMRVAVLAGPVWPVRLLWCPVEQGEVFWFVCFLFFALKAGGVGRESGEGLVIQAWSLRLMGWVNLGKLFHLFVPLFLCF